MTERLLSAREVADLLLVPESWVRAETRAGRLPHVELGRYRRYVEADVLAWLADNKRGGTAAASYRKHEPRVRA